MIYYAIRHKATGELMPELKRRGYSFWNPTTNSIPDTITGCPRLLKSQKQAERCIVQWACLPNARERQYQSGFYGDEIDIELTTKPDGRKKEDLEIIQVNIKIKGPNDPFWKNL